jgi:phenylacetate-coenzyme A ligase PaaK-like adenylate-forming protein
LTAAEWQQKNAAVGSARRSVGSELAAGAPSPAGAEAVYRARDAWLRRLRGATPEEERRLLLQHARRTVPFYRRAANGELPIVDRALYLRAPDDFRSSATPLSPYRLASTGTTGPRLEFSVDEAAWYAINHHFFEQVRELAGLEPEVFEPARPGVLFVSNKPSRVSSVLPLPALRDSLYVRLQLGMTSDALRATVDRLRAPILYGKPTYLVDLRAALIAAGAARPPWSPELVLVSGETLHADDRERLTSYFGAPLVDALASTEGGLVAATRPDGETYEVFPDNARLEVLAPDGTVSSSGTGELVLTSLVHRATVFVRYRSGDRAELCSDPSTGRQRLERLWGREPESIRLASDEVSPAAVTAAIGFVTGVGDFQLLFGDGRPVVLRWSSDPAHEDVERTETRLRARVRALLPDEEVTLEHRPRLTPLGGKKRRFVPVGQSEER